MDVLPLQGPDTTVRQQAHKFKALTEPLRLLWDAAWPFAYRLDICVNCYVSSKDEDCTGHTTSECHARTSGGQHVYNVEVTYRDGPKTRTVKLAEVRNYTQTDGDDADALTQPADKEHAPFPRANGAVQGRMLEVLVLVRRASSRETFEECQVRARGYPAAPRFHGLGQATRSVGGGTGVAVHHGRDRLHRLLECAEGD